MTDLPASKVDLKSILSTPSRVDNSEGMSYLQSVPRRIVTLYIPLSIIVTSQDTGVHAWGSFTSTTTLDLHVWNNWQSGYAYDYYDYDPTYVQITAELYGFA